MAGVPCLRSALATPGHKSPIVYLSPGLLEIEVARVMLRLSHSSSSTRPDEAAIVSEDSPVLNLTPKFFSAPA